MYLAAVWPIWALGGLESHPVVIGGRPDPLLIETDLPNFSTTMISYGDQAFRPKGTIVVYAGLGARSKAFGIGPSLEPILKKAIKEGFAPYAFENPLYNDSIRQHRLSYFSTTSGQLEWLTNTSKLIASAPNVRQPLIIAGRSTTSALILEALHRYLSSGVYSDIFSRVDKILIMGPVDPRPAEFQKWRKIEIEYLQQRDGLLDPVAYAAEDTVYKDMRFATDAVKNVPGLKIPEITFIAGTNDPFATAAEQVSLARTFQRLHPDTKVKVIVTDTFHNPAASIEYLGKDGDTVKVKTMKRLSPILSELFSEKRGNEPGFSIVIQPEVQHLVNACVLSLKF